MTAIDTTTALGLVKARLNRLESDHTLDSYLTARLEAAITALEDTGITLDGESPNDLMLVVDSCVWEYQNRDKPGGMPDWLRQRRRERWVQEVKNRDT